MGEQIRGCGFRKLGALYLVGGQLSRPCGRFPIFVHVCPTCGGGIKQARGWTWVDPVKLIGIGPCNARTSSCADCPMADPAFLANDKGKCGLIWIGTAFYKTPAEFSAEAARLGVSRRITQIPRGLVPGNTWVLLAHPKVPDPHGRDQPRPGIFGAFKVTAIEKMVTEEETQNEEEMTALQKRGITPVVLPDLPQHRGSVYDDTPQTDLEDENT